MLAFAIMGYGALFMVTDTSRCAPVRYANTAWLVFFQIGDGGCCVAQQAAMQQSDFLVEAAGLFVQPGARCPRESFESNTTPSRSWKCAGSRCENTVFLCVGHKRALLQSNSIYKRIQGLSQRLSAQRLHTLSLLCIV